MKALTFSISGKIAFFKRPDVNAYAYFTYNNIPKIALLGILGAIIGLKGYRQQTTEQIYPEFYDKLKNLKISIIPKSEKGYFSKKIQVINNTTGFENKDSNKIPCTLNYREQWLYDPCWQIYILDDDSIDKDTFNKLKDYLLNSKCEYIPYLGKNEHAASIKNVEYIKIENAEDITYVDSIVENSIKFGATTKDGSNVNQYIESLPVRLNNVDNAYEFDNFIFTNLNVEEYPSNMLFYRHSGKTLYFF
jgi:CRISPR-associated protein Cas5h